MNSADFAKKYHLNKKKVSKAMKKLKSKEVVVFGISGKMGSGKDTIGELVAKEFSAAYTSFATPVREEISEIIESGQGDLSTLSTTYNASEVDLSELFELMEGKSIYERTPEARKALQFWATDLRRTQYYNYWVDKTLELIVDNLSEGKSMYISDLRFVNEVEAFLDLGCKVFRLDVPTEVRIERLTKRDGVTPKKEHLEHVSELALDNYEFEHTINGCQSPDDIAKEIIKLQKKDT